MKKLILLPFLAAACATHQPLPELPQFDKQKVCSAESLKYMESRKSMKPSTPKFHTEEEIHTRMINLEPQVKKCYEELLASDGTASFNLCFIFGFDLKGKLEYFQFSTNEFQTPASFNQCLDKIKSSKELLNLKNISVLQPFKLYPVPAR